METINLTKEEFKRLRLTDYSNRILVKKLTNNKKLTSKNGIIVLPVVYKQNEAEHIDRVFEVVKQPKKLKFIGGIVKYHEESDNFSHQGTSYFIPPVWKTTIETEIGDIVISSKRGSDGALEIVVDDEKYYLIDYHTLYLSLRPGKPEIKKIMNISIKKITPLNGYIICESIEEGLKSDYIILLPSTKSKVNHGIVKHIGMPNERYYDEKQYSDDGADIIKPGDKIRKRKAEIHRDLENNMHAVFSNENLFVIQRRDILYYEVS